MNKYTDDDIRNMKKVTLQIAGERLLYIVQKGLAFLSDLLQQP